MFCKMCFVNYLFDSPFDVFALIDCMLSFSSVYKAREAGEI